MYLKTLALINFRLCSEQEFSFLPGVNCFIGNNGSGKTNVLDGIHYLSLCKSYINPSDGQQIQEGKDFFMIQGNFFKDQRDEQVSCTVKRNQKKQFRRNKKDYEKLSDHIGLFPVVMISPYDINLIFEGSEERRRFLDNALSQTDPEYLEVLIRYNRVLNQRNSFLKQNQGSYPFDDTLLGIFDEDLSKLGTRIFEKRKEFIEVFEPLFQKHYQFMTDGAEVVDMTYESSLFEQDYSNGLSNSRSKDLLLERTSFGIHKDDLEFFLKGMALKRSGSQGQQKSFLIALKLAHNTYLQGKLGYKPILLLDDIFDKLDDLRVEKLMDMVISEEFGQVFVTDTNSERMERIFKRMKHSYGRFMMQNGQVESFENFS